MLFHPENSGIFLNQRRTASDGNFNFLNWQCFVTTMASSSPQSSIWKLKICIFNPLLTLFV